MGEDGGGGDTSTPSSEMEVKAMGVGGEDKVAAGSWADVLLGLQ
jgi:hypothetical protein